MSERVQNILRLHGDEIRKMRLNGYPLHIIAKQYEISTTTISTFLNDKKPRQNKWQDMIGKYYNHIMVLRRSKPEEYSWKSHETALWVKCGYCDYEWSARKGDIEKGYVKCPECAKPGGRGHWDREKIGMRFGKLTIIDKAPTHRSIGGNYASYWICKCDCGNIVNVSQKNLFGKKKDGYISRTISCGCASKSSGQLKMEKTFTDAGISFQAEYAIKEFSQFSKFDIALLDKNNKMYALIEYDGAQHFIPVEHFGGEEQLKIQQERDQRKNQYCKEHNIPLFRLTDDDYDNMSIQYLFCKFPELRDLVQNNSDYYKED